MEPVTHSALAARGWILYPTQDESFWVHKSNLLARHTQDLTEPVYLAKRGGPIRMAMQHSPAARRIIAHLAETSHTDRMHDYALGY